MKTSKTSKVRKSCRMCATPFRPKIPKQVFCSDDCRKLFWTANDPRHSHKAGEGRGESPQVFLLREALRLGRKVVLHPDGGIEVS